MLYKLLRRILYVSLFVTFASPSFGGQVVTDDVKQWAKQVIAQEKSLQTANEPNTLAILYFSNKTHMEELNPLEKGMAFMLMTDLAKVPEIQLVERIKLQALIDEMQLSVSGLVDPLTSTRLGRLLGAEHLVGGDIFKHKLEQFKISSNLLNTPAEKIAGQTEADGKLITEIFRMEKEILFDIITMLKLQLTAKQIEELKKPMTSSLNALLHIFEAIELSDRKQYQKASEAYEKALEADPGVYVARAAINEIQNLGLLDEVASDDEKEAQTKASPGPVEAYDVADALVLDDVLPDEKLGDNPKEIDRTEKGDALAAKGVIPTSGNIALSWTFVDDDSEQDGTADVASEVAAAAYRSVFSPTQTLLPYETQTEKARLESETPGAVNQTNLRSAALEDIRDALAAADIREADAWQTKQIDAQAGRVLRDRNGDWVRIDQFIVRPDAQTVHVFNQSVRIKDGNTFDAMKMEWNTTFTEDYTGDLRQLPWSKWLNTQETDDAIRYVMTDPNAPELDSMQVTFTNPLNEYWQAYRGFQEKGNALGAAAQVIDNDLLSFKTFTMATPRTYAMDGYRIRANEDGLVYQFADGFSDVDISFSAADETLPFKDIWDVLRVNEAGAADIGEAGALEIAIDSSQQVFSQTIDVLYIPMSHMEWTDK